MFAAVRASRAIRRSSGRRKGRGKLLRCSTFNGGAYTTGHIYHDTVSNPELQTSRSKDSTYTQIAPYNGSTRPGGRAFTYLFQFIIEGLPVEITPGTGILVPDGMLKFHSYSGTYSRAWHNMPSRYSDYSYGTSGSGRFRRTYRNYLYYQWMIYCVAGSTAQQAKYRLVPEHYAITGTSAGAGRYIAAPLSRFRNFLSNHSDQTLISNIGNYSNRGYSAARQGQNTWLVGNYNVGQGHRRFYPYGYQLDLTFLGMPGKFIEWRRQ